MLVTLDAETENVIRRVIGATFEVSNALGHGFLEKVYQRALARELAAAGVALETEVSYEIRYKGDWVGTYVADMVVAGRLIVELKTVDALTQAHVGQLLNYLRASDVGVGLLVNFGKPKVEYRRVLSPKHHPC